ncbi:MAG: DUF58 domain-containing protein [Chromatocurvus sp.]
MDSLIRGYRARLARWVDRRIPAASRVILDRRRIFIFPSRVGFFFFAALLVMLVAAINYENNMSYALTFLLATLFVIAVLHTYANLSGLILQGCTGSSGFPGDLLAFRVRLAGAGKGRYSLVTRWRDAALNADEAMVDVSAQGTSEVLLYARAEQRGRLRPGRVLVESRYPLGLLRCWTWIDLGLSGVVYPLPRRNPEPRGSASESTSERPVAATGDDEFYGLRDYRSGDRPRQVYWKGLARGQPLQSKQYSSYADSDEWLDWSSYPGVPAERRLSYLCHQCLTLHARRRQYGLRLPDVHLAPSAGAAHRDRVLTALALFSEPPE